MHRSDGNLQVLCRLFRGESAEDTEFGDFGLTFIEIGQSIQYLVNIAEGDVRRSGRFGGIGEADQGNIAAALLSVTRFTVSTQNPTHHLRSDPEQVSAIAEVHAMLRDHPHVSLIYERGWLQGVACALAADVGGGQSAKLVVNQRNHFVEKKFFAELILLRKVHRKASP